MGKSPITTPARFLYLNAYAFLLVFGGIGIAFCPLYRLHGSLGLLQAAAVFACLIPAVNIFRTWNDKKRKYNVLVQRNRDGFRPDTFTEFMQAPCGRLLVKTVLSDLNRKEEYKHLKALKVPPDQIFKSACKTKKNVMVYVNPNFIDTDNTAFK